MANLVYRQAKGSALTYGELDGNLAELDRRTAAGWQNLRGSFDISGVPNPPTMTLYQGIYLPAFDPDNVNEGTAVIHMPHDYIQGSDIYPHGHFLSATNSSGTVRWGFTFSFANEGDAFSPPQTGYVEYAIPAGGKDIHRVAETAGAFSIPTLEKDSCIFMRVFRDATHANDTFPDDIFLFQVDLYYQSQGFGTASR